MTKRYRCGFPRGRAGVYGASRRRSRSPPARTHGPDGAPPQPGSPGGHDVVDEQHRPTRGQVGPPRARYAPARLARRGGVQPGLVGGRRTGRRMSATSRPDSSPTTRTRSATGRPRRRRAAARGHRDQDRVASGIGGLDGAGESGRGPTAGHVGRHPGQANSAVRTTRRMAPPRGQGQAHRPGVGSARSAFGPEPARTISAAHCGHHACDVAPQPAQVAGRTRSRIQSRGPMDPAQPTRARPTRRPRPSCGPWDDRPTPVDDALGPRAGRFP